MPVERVEKIMDARPEGNAFQHPRVKRTVPRRIEYGRIDVRFQLLTNEPGIFGLGNPDKTHEEGRLQLMAQAPKDARPYLELKSFGVEQEAIQIEDDTGETYRHAELQEVARASVASKV